MAVFRRETSSNANKRQNYSDVVFQKWTCDAFKTIFLVKCQKASQALLTLFQKNDTAKNGQLLLKINPAQRILCFGSLFRWDEKIIKDHQQTMIIFGCLTSNGPKRELGRRQLFLRNVFGSKRPSDQKKTFEVVWSAFRVNFISRHVYCLTNFLQWYFLPINRHVSFKPANIKHDQNKQVCFLFFSRWKFPINSNSFQQNFRFRTEAFVPREWSIGPQHEHIKPSNEDRILFSLSGLQGS